MKKVDSNNIQQLCSLIAAEHDHRKFLSMVEELNRILSLKDESTEHPQPAKREDA